MDEWILLNEKEYYSTGKYHTFNTLDDALASEITGSVMTKNIVNNICLVEFLKQIFLFQ
jgi:hypothetical protein